MQSTRRILRKPNDGTAFAPCLRNFPLLPIRRCFERPQSQPFLLQQSVPRIPAFDTIGISLVSFHGQHLKFMSLEINSSRPATRRHDLRNSMSQNRNLAHSNIGGSIEVWATHLSRPEPQTTQTPERSSGSLAGLSRGAAATRWRESPV